MVNDKADDKKLDRSQNRCQFWLETSMRGTDFIFDCVYSLYYKCHKISLKWGRSWANQIKNCKEY